MEHTFVATAAVLAVTAAAVIGIFAMDGFFEAPEEASAEKEISVSEEPEQQRVFLGVFEGKLAVFAGESPYPNMVYDFFIRNLPEEDRKRLAGKIEVFSEEELEALLEDYMS